ncbi:type III secretion system export apparatus subunit SctU [Photobacterium sp. J15]|uniref:type III secretion system export apparatus subunit SctU n=1 Tax=Photobacterium sp. J15 TaxID=265901 RepID=UPI0007E419F5|nr:type III secretion system export apparatus subunit SctU [Photobacterium sp. J15]
MSEKTEKPTPKKVRDARKKGQVAKSKEIPSLATMLVTIMWLVIDHSRLMVKLEALFTLPTRLIDLPFSKAAEVAMQQTLTLIMEMLAPFLAAIVLTGIVANIGQFGPLFAPEALKIDINKLNPVSGAKKIFSTKNLVEFFISLLKILILGLMVALVMRFHLRDVLLLPYNPTEALLPVAGQLFLLLCLFVISPLILIALLDLLYQRYNHEKELKMSKDEVKREFKDSEGNPEIKGKRKEFHRELQANSMPKQLKKTSVVVANPTHLVVGLRYDEEDCKIPAVSLKYKGVQARKLRKLAEQEGIPVLENIPLARALHAEVDLYDAIPAHLFEPVAEVIKWLKMLENNEK